MGAPDLHPVEAVSLIGASVLLLVSAVALPLRPALARGGGVTAILLAAGALAYRAPLAPPLAFVALAAIAVLAFGLLTTEPDADVPIEREITGLLWSRAVMLSAIAALAVGGTALANQSAPSELTKPLVAALFTAASSISLLAEYQMFQAGLRRRRSLVALAVVTALAALVAPFSPAALAVLAARLLYSIGWAARERNIRSDLFGLARLRPASFALGSFGLAAVAGAMLLALPMSSARPGGINIVDALFTAMSAVCVTGLVVVDTGLDLSFVGQIILLLLIQIGGLGIMTLSALMTVVAGRSLRGGDERALGESIGVKSTPAAILRTIRSIAIGTVGIELLGAVALFTTTRDRFESTAEALWFATFHSISAFCNAGFALDAASVSTFSSDPVVLHIFSFLIIAGGAGFGVMYGLAQLTLQSFRRLSGQAQRRRAPDVNVLIVGITSAMLLVGGFAVYLAIEWNASLAQLGLVDKVHNAWFQSVTFRTAGFNSVPLEQMEPSMLVLSLVLMFVGASPGSTGGGVKTTTVAVLCLSLRTVFTGRNDTEAFGRRIDPAVVKRAMAVTLFAGSTVLVGAFLLMLTQHAPFEVLLFEATSAVGTVGLTIGGTGILDDSGKVIVMGLMLLGRVGPLSAAAMLERATRGTHRFPKAEVIVG